MTQLQNTVWLTVLSLATAGNISYAQTPATGDASGSAAEVQRAYAGLKGNILKAADKMPAESYSYKPTPEIRTFARVVNHITEAQMRSCSAANAGTASTGNSSANKNTAALPPMPPETADKAVIVQALQASFAVCDKAFAALTEANLTDTLTAGPAKRSRIGLMWGTVSHDNEQYATLALYLRLKGLVPPSSEK